MPVSTAVGEEGPRVDISQLVGQVELKKGSSY